MLRDSSGLSNGRELPHFASSLLVERDVVVPRCIVDAVELQHSIGLFRRFYRLAVRNEGSGIFDSQIDVGRRESDRRLKNAGRFRRFVHSIVQKQTCQPSPRVDAARVGLQELLPLAAGFHDVGTTSR